MVPPPHKIYFSCDSMFLGGKESSSHNNLVEDVGSWLVCRLQTSHMFCGDSFQEGRWQGSLLYRL